MNTMGAAQQSVNMCLVLVTCPSLLPIRQVDLQASPTRCCPAPMLRQGGASGSSMLSVRPTLAPCFTLRHRFQMRKRKPAASRHRCSVRSAVYLNTRVAHGFMLLRRFAGPVAPRRRRQTPSAFLIGPAVVTNSSIYVCCGYCK